MRCLRNAK